jgi:transposase-like protein
VLKTALSKMDVTDPAKLQTVIQFCVNLGKTPGETKTMIKSVTNKPSVCPSLVYKWHRRFSDGRESVGDDSRTGGSVEVRDKETVESVRAKINEDRRISLRQISNSLNLSYGTVQKIVTEELEMCRSSARWVP